MEKEIKKERTYVLSKNKQNKIVFNTIKYHHNISYPY